MRGSSRPPGVALLVAAAILLVGAPAAGAAGKPSKVASSVEQLAADVGQARAAGRSPRALSNDVLKATSEGAIEVNVWALGQVGNRERAELIRLGANVVATATGPARRGQPAYGVFHAAVPHDRLDAVAALEWVAAVTPPDYGYAEDHPTNPTNSQGVALHNADDVQTRGINGAGVNVGVISNGAPSIAASDLPAVTVNNTGCAAGTAGCDEGTAMLEIVHDMAPGAGLFFDAGAGGGVAGHVGAQNWLAAAGRANVITEDMAFDGEPAFQYGLAASNGDAIAASGVSMHSSAGNLGNQHTARVAATGTGQGPDGGTGPCAGGEPDNGVAIAGGGDNTFDLSVPTLVPAVTGSLTLQWSEPRAIFPTAGQGGFTALDLYVLRVGAGGALTCGATAARDRASATRSRRSAVWPRATTRSSLTSRTPPRGWPCRRSTCACGTRRRPIRRRGRAASTRTRTTPARRPRRPRSMPRPPARSSRSRPAARSSS